MDTKPKSPQLRRLLQEGRHYKIPKGQIIQSSDDRIMLNLLITGFVKRYLITSDGSLGVQSIFGPNYIFPLTPVFKTLLNQTIYSGPEVYYYESMTNVEVYTIDQETLHAAVVKNPSLYQDLFSEAGVRLQDNIQRLENLSLKSSYKRLAHQLAYYARQFGEDSHKEIALDMALTHQDLADSLSLTRETVSTSMIKLREAGLVKTGKKITVLDLKKLEEEAYR